jgi:cytoskeletal protein CcmA (bactofilin family)
MASILRIKRSDVSGNPAVLGAGELAYSALSDNGTNGGDRLYIGTGTETAGNAVNHVVIGGKYFTDLVTAATPLNTALTIVRRDATGSIAVNVTGALTGNASTATAWQNPRSLGLTGDATASFASVDGTQNLSTAITLATVNTDVGTYGSASAIPIFTVNGKGLITAVTTAAVASSLNILGGTGSGTVSLLSDSLTFEGGTGVTTSIVDNKKVLIQIGQAVGVTSNVTFNDVTVNGNLYSNDITATNLTLDGNATITGNLTIQGTTTTVNSTTVAIGDANITLAKDAANAAEANGAGLTVAGAGATFIYTSTNNRWNLNRDLDVGTVYGALSGNASTATALQTARTIAITGDITYNSGNFDGTANVTAAATLATVNSNVGNFGDAVTVPNFTVNAKGLITAAGSTAIPTATALINGLASFASTNFNITGGLVAISQVDGGTY